MTQKYRGVCRAHVITIIEGNGEDIPFESVRYVLMPDSKGVLESVGKIVPLTPEEKSLIGNEIPQN